jgi:hypothetical protein
MSAIKNNIIEVRFRTTQDVRARLAHHAERIGTDMNDIVRQGTLEFLDRLDEQEMLALERKRDKERRGAFVPSVPEHRWGTPPGLGRENKEKKMPVMSFLPKPLESAPVPEKLTRSFRRWAEFIEGAEDRSDGERRAETVLQDMYERCEGEAEKAKCYETFKTFMQERKEALEKPTGVVNVGDIAIAGDVD